MKIRGLFKKAAATLMAAVTALSILPATTAFASARFPLVTPTTAAAML